MNHVKHHWLEKLQVQVVTLGLLAASYFLFWPLVHPWEPNSPATFLPLANSYHLVLLAVLLVAMGFVGALVTTNIRPQGALLAVLLGAGGVSLHSPPIRTLLWIKQDNYASMYHGLVVELLVLAVAIFAVWFVVLAVRWGVGAVCPACAWKNPLVEPSRAATQTARGTFLQTFQQMWLSRAHEGSHQAVRNVKTGEWLAQAGCFLLVGLILSALFLWLMLNSGERPQVILSLVLGLTLGVFIAHQVFPTPFAILPLAVPIVLGVFSYVLASITSVSGAHDAWMKVQPYGLPLPVDWATVGCGGAMLGHWISARVHELRHFESLQEEQGQA